MKIEEKHEQLELIINSIRDLMKEQGYKTKRFSETENGTTEYDCLVLKDSEGKEFTIGFKESLTYNHQNREWERTNYIKVLKDVEILELLNSMEIVEHSASCGEVEYVIVHDNEDNRRILYKIGLSDKDITEECYPDGGYLDISSIGFKYANWYSGKTKQFSINEPSKENEVPVVMQMDSINKV